MTWLMLVALGCYGLLIPLWWTASAQRYRSGAILLWTGIGAHVLGILTALSTNGVDWLRNAEHAIAVIALTCAVTYALAVRNPRWRAFSGIFVPLIFFWQLIAVTHDLLFPRAALLEQQIQSIWLPIHLLVAMITFALLLMGAVSGVTYWISAQQLKSRRIGTWRLRLPSLPSQERALALEILAGVIGLTLTIITGVILQAGLGQRSHMWLPLIGWGIYSVVLHGHYWRSAPARRMIILSLLGFGVIVAAFIEAHRTL